MTQPARRIVGVSPVGEAGGAETLLLDVLVGAQRRGREVVLVVLGDGPLGELARRRGLVVEEGPAVDGPRPDRVLAASRVVRSLATPGDTVVYANHPKGHVVARLAAAGRAPVVAQVHDPPPANEVAARIAAHLGDARIANGVRTRDAWQSHARRGSVRAIVPGVDAAELRSRAHRGDAAAVWRSAGLAPQRRRYVLLARLQRFKGALDLIEVLSRSGSPDETALLIGPDAPTEPGFRAELRAAIRERGLQERVALTGRIHEDDVAAVLADATALVHPARDESFGLVLVESLALGTPVVAYAGPGPSEILRHGGGILVRDGDLVGLRAGLDGVDTIALDSIASAAGRFSLERVIDSYLEVFDTALNGWRTASHRPR